MEGNGYDLVEILSTYPSGETEEYPRKTTYSVVDVGAEIRTRHVLNTN
jgi:hypothetical protein